MRLHHVGGYSKEERDGYREIVYANLVRPEAFAPSEEASFCLLMHILFSLLVADPIYASRHRGAP